MFDFLLVERLSNRLRDLATFRRDNDRQRFAVAVTDIFEDLTTIHTDYLKLFEKCLTSLSRHESIADIVESFSTARIELEAARRSTAIVANTLAGENNFKKYWQFLEYVRIYLGGLVTTTDGPYTSLSPSSQVGDLLRIVAGRPVVNDSDWDFLIRNTTFTLDNIRIVWEIVSQAYADALAQAT